MFCAKLAVRVGEMPDAARWEDDEILEKTMAIVGLPLLRAGFEVVVDVDRSYFDRTSFQAREYHITTDDDGTELSHRDSRW